MPAYVVLIFSGFAGFILAFYIWNQKRLKKGKMVCPLRGNCQAVVTSSYAKFLGVPVEVLGMAYYALIALGYGILASIPVDPPLLTYSLLVVTAAALLFSLYLTFIQVFTLRQICTWCFGSAGLSIFIFILAYASSIGEVTGFLGAHQDKIVILHVLFMALGLGAATVADYFFFRFIKDYRISSFESDVLSHLSEFVWFALAGVVLTGLGLFLPESSELLQSPKFLAKMTIVGILIVNGAFLNLVVAPHLVRMSFDRKKEHHHRPGELRRHRRLAFALGPLSAVSWYSAFLLGSARSLPFSYLEIIGAYAIVVLGGVVFGQLIERYLVKKASKAA